MTVYGVPMTDYMENIIKRTMASKAGQVIFSFVLFAAVLRYIHGKGNLFH